MMIRLISKVIFVYSLLFSPIAMSGGVGPSNYEELLDTMIDGARVASDDSFEVSWGPSRPEIDRRSVILTLETLKKEIKSKRHRWQDSSIVNSLIRGAFYPDCLKGNGIDPKCTDFDRAYVFQPNLEVAFRFAQKAYDEEMQSSLLASFYRNGWIVKKDLLKAFDLYMEDRNMNGAALYYWADINRMVQQELVLLGEDLIIDGDFGFQSCKSLSKYIGMLRCEKTVTRNQLVRFISEGNIASTETYRDGVEVQ